MPASSAILNPCLTYFNNSSSGPKNVSLIGMSSPAPNFLSYVTLTKTPESRVMSKACSSSASDPPGANLKSIELEFSATEFATSRILSLVNR